MVTFKQKFYPSTWSNYGSAKPPTLKLTPPEFRLTELNRDYQAMQSMFFDQRLSFSEVMQILSALESEINALEHVA